MSLLKKKLVSLKANAFTTASSIVNNNDAFYFLPKILSNQPSPNNQMTSFSSLFFSVGIFWLSGQTAGITILGISSSGGVTGNFLGSLFISLFEPIFMSVLLTKILLLYPSVLPMLQFKSLGSMYMPVPTEK